MPRLSKQKIRPASALKTARGRLAASRRSRLPLRRGDGPQAALSAVRDDQALSGGGFAATGPDAAASCRNVAMLAQLSRELAHSINNVLGVARGNLHLMRPRISDTECAEMLQDALGALGDLEALSSELELFSGDEDFAVEVVDFGRLLQRHAGDFSAACGGCAIELDIEGGAFPLLGLTDQRHFVAAVRGLLPLPPAGGPAGSSLTIRCIRRAAPAATAGGGLGSIEISVGSRMFCADAGANPALMSRANGYLELGMWFARQVARASGGRFYHALDREGYPTRLLFVLPAAQEPGP